MTEVKPIVEDGKIIYPKYKTVEEAAQTVKQKERETEQLMDKVWKKVEQKQK